MSFTEDLTPEERAQVMRLREPNTKAAAAGERWRITTPTRCLDTGGGTGLPPVTLEPGYEFDVVEPWSPRLDWFCCLIVPAGANPRDRTLQHELRTRVAEFAERVQ